MIHSLVGTSVSSVDGTTLYPVPTFYGKVNQSAEGSFLRSLQSTSASQIDQTSVGQSRLSLAGSSVGQVDQTSTALVVHLLSSSLGAVVDVDSTGAVESGAITHQIDSTSDSQVDQTSSGLSKRALASTSNSQVDQTSSGSIYNYLVSTSDSQVDQTSTAWRVLPLDSLSSSSVDSDSTGAIESGAITHQIDASSDSRVDGVASAVLDLEIVAASQSEIDSDTSGQISRALASSSASQVDETSVAAVESTLYGTIASQIDSQSVGVTQRPLDSTLDSEIVGVSSGNIKIGFSGVSDSRVDQFSVGGEFDTMASLSSSRMDADSLGSRGLAVGSSSLSITTTTSQGSRLTFFVGLGDSQADEAASGTALLLLVAPLASQSAGSGIGSRVAGATGADSATINGVSIGSRFVPINSSVAASIDSSTVSAVVRTLLAVSQSSSDSLSDGHLGIILRSALLGSVDGDATGKLILDWVRKRSAAPPPPKKLRSYDRPGSRRDFRYLKGQTDKLHKKIFPKLQFFKKPEDLPQDFLYNETAIEKFLTWEPLLIEAQITFDPPQTTHTVVGTEELRSVEIDVRVEEGSKIEIGDAVAVEKEFYVISNKVRTHYVGVGEFRYAMYHFTASKVRPSSINPDEIPDVPSGNTLFIPDRDHRFVAKESSQLFRKLYPQFELFKKPRDIAFDWIYNDVEQEKFLGWDRSLIRSHVTMEPQPATYTKVGAEEWRSVDLEFPLELEGVISQGDAIGIEGEFYVLGRKTRRNYVGNKQFRHTIIHCVGTKVRPSSINPDEIAPRIDKNTLFVSTRDFRFLNDQHARYNNYLFEEITYIKAKRPINFSVYNEDLHEFLLKGERYKIPTYVRVNPPDNLFEKFGFSKDRDIFMSISKRLTEKLGVPLPKAGDLFYFENDIYIITDDDHGRYFGDHELTFSLHVTANKIKYLENDSEEIEDLTTADPYDPEWLYG